MAAALLAAAILAVAATGIVIRSEGGGGHTPEGPIILAMFGGRPDPAAPASAVADNLATSLLQGLQQGVREGLPARVAGRSFGVGTCHARRLYESRASEPRRRGRTSGSCRAHG
jgi:hypothetical protein